jgi:hypothetical protein
MNLHNSKSDIHCQGLNDMLFSSVQFQEKMKREKAEYSPVDGNS